MTSTYEKSRNPSAEVSQLSFAECLPILALRPLRQLAPEQNQQLFDRLASRGRTQARYTVLHCFLFAAFFVLFAVVIDANVHLKVWVALHGLTVLGVLAALCVDRPKKEAVQGFRRFAISQVLIAVPGAIAWSSIYYAMGQGDDVLGELALPVFTAAATLTAFWLSTVPLVAVVWFIVAAVNFILIDPMPNHGQYYFVMCMWLFTCTVLCLFLHRSFVKLVLADLQLEERKRVNELLLAEFEEHSSDFLWHTDLQGRVAYASKKLLQLCDVGNVDGRPSLPDFLALDAAKHHDLEQKCRSLTAFSDYRIRMKDARGSHRWFALSGHPVVDGHGERVGIRGAGTEITANVTMERQEQEARTASAISRMASSLAHDFNNYLAAVSMSIEAATAMDADMPSSAKQCIEHALAAAEQAAHLSRNLLSISKNDVLEPTEVDLNNDVRAVVESVRSMYTNRLVFCIDVEAGATISVDRTQFNRALRNVIENAALALNGTGTITVSVAPVDGRDHEEREGCSASGQIRFENYFRVRVADDGPGFDKDILHSATQAFVSTRKMSGGTGIGLAMASGFCSQSDGALIIKNGTSGAVVDMIFPAIAGNIENAATESECEPIDTSRLTGKQVVLLDDQDDIRRSIAIALRQAGLNVKSYRSLEAIRSALHKLEFVDFLISDLVLDDGYGYEICDELQAGHPDVKTVFITGFIEQASLRRSKLHGPVLLKPFAMNQLLQQLLAT